MTPPTRGDYRILSLNGTKADSIRRKLGVLPFNHPPKNHNLVGGVRRKPYEAKLYF